MVVFSDSTNLSPFHVNDDGTFSTDRRPLGNAETPIRMSTDSWLLSRGEKSKSVREYHSEVKPPFLDSLDSPPFFNMPFPRLRRSQAEETSYLSG